jgi:diguanylate cyclase (GGDEF)-like protein/PAS domain S-box-containing protein
MTRTRKDSQHADPNGKPAKRGGIVKHRDVQGRTLAEDTQRASFPTTGALGPRGEEFFRMIVENGEDFFAVLDLEGRRLYNSPSYANLFGDVERMKGSDSFAEIHPADLQLVERAFKETVQSGRSHRLNFRFMLADGRIRYMESCGALIRNSQGQAFRVAVVSRDITERMENEQEIYNLAFYDSLTQLPNRRLLSDRLDQAMATSKRSGRHGALMLLDLDNFKLLNDTHGHAVGDLLLPEVGRRITSCLREMDTVARLGGDEFVLVLCELDKDKARSAVESGIVAEKILAILAEPYELKFQRENNTEATIEFRCTASIGVVLFIDHEASREGIIKQADMAMYQAKAAGRNLIRFYAAKP